MFEGGPFGDYFHGILIGVTQKQFLESTGLGNSELNKIKQFREWILASDY